MLKLNPDRAIVLFSGGQDSAIALAFALGRFKGVETAGFDYGQRHGVEMAARAAIRREISAAFPEWQTKLGDDTIIDLRGFGRLSETALTREAEIVVGAAGLPTTFVPGRNLLFLVCAGALAYRRGAGVLVGGMCEADYSGYPDCRSDALAAQLTALRLGMDAELRLEAPLMQLTKAESWSLADSLGGKALVDLIVEHSHTCYRGDRTVRHPWGYGCAECPACELRARGWLEYSERRR
jgi:7-cyano-7-deazaguanine synthase